MRERAAMEVEREVVDLYRALFMRDHVNDVYEAHATSLAGSGLYASIDHPFVDVLVRYEAMGPDQYNLSEDELSAVGARSGDTISLGDRVLVTIEDVAILRRQTYGRRVPPEALLKQLKDAPELPRRMQRLTTSHGGPGAKRGGRPQADARSQNRSKGRGPEPRREEQQDRRPSKGKPARGRSDATARPSTSRSDATGRGKPGKRGGGGRRK
jgi:ribonuclease R